MPYKNKEDQKNNARKYFENHREKWRNHNKAYFQKLKCEVLSHYSDGIPRCACCGETQIEFLTIDHIDGSGCRDRKIKGKGSGLQHYLWIKRNNYPEGYQVLCWNCNCAKKQFDACPHVSVNKSNNLIKTGGLAAL